MQKSFALGWVICVVLVTAALIAGCGGGEAPGGGGGTILPVGTASLTGAVFAADAVASGLFGAEIIVSGTGRTAVADANGGFLMQGLPAGEYAVEAQTPNHPDYGTARARVTLADGVVTTVNFAVLPADAPEPAQILLDPDVAIIDLNAKIAYRTQVVGPNNAVIADVEPTWVVAGGIGTITRAGVFTGTSVGNGTVTAFAGGIQVVATVQVDPPGPPNISSFQLNPRSIPASGGDVYIAAAIDDGDGIDVADVVVEIFGPGNQQQLLGTSIADPATAEQCVGQAGCYTRATLATTFNAPANDNQPTTGGIQAPENYSAHVIVTDRSGAKSTSAFIDFVVEGIDPPPPTPPL